MGVRFYMLVVIGFIITANTIMCLENKGSYLKKTINLSDGW